MINPLFMTCLIVFVAQLCVAVILFVIGELKYGQGLVWALYGWLACLGMQIVYLAYTFWAASMRVIRANSESRRVRNFFRYYRETLAELSDSMQIGNTDNYLEALLAEDRLDLAAQHANEMMISAHEQGDRKKEQVYRRALEEIAHRRSVAD